MKSILPLTLAAVMSTMLITSSPVRAAGTDSRIESSAAKSYTFKTYLKDDSIKTVSKDGVVTLTGTVADSSHKSMAEIGQPHRIVRREVLHVQDLSQGRFNQDGFQRRRRHVDRHGRRFIAQIHGRDRTAASNRPPRSPTRSRLISRTIQSRRFPKTASSR